MLSDHERIHQIIEPQHEANQGETICSERLGGLLKSTTAKQRDPTLLDRVGEMVCSGSNTSYHRCQIAIAAKGYMPPGYPHVSRRS